MKIHGNSDREQKQICLQVYDAMGDGFINRENMFQLLRTSLVSQAGDEDAEESVRVTIVILG